MDADKTNIFLKAFMPLSASIGLYRQLNEFCLIA